MRETQDFKDFSITSWYDQFKNISMRTIIVELSECLLKRFQLPEAPGDSEDENIEKEEEPFPQDLKDKIKNALNSLGRTVFVKNNWHAPTDAKMFSIGNTLKAQNIDDIILYFSTSDLIQEDFSNIKGVPFCLAFRKWTNIHPAAEFRCIVINNVLRGITPRDWPTFYPHFKEEAPQLIETILRFFSDYIQSKFPRKTYIFDIVLSYPDEPYILDFGPLNSRTNLYAFSWKEISPLLNKEVPNEIAPVFRYLESDIGIMTKSSALLKFQQLI